MVTISEGKVNAILRLKMGKFNIPVLTVFEMDGQSNMIVADTLIDPDLPVAYRGVQSGVKTYFKTTRSSTDDGSWQDLNSGVNNIDPTLLPANFFGMDSKFPRDLKDNFGVNPYIVKSARGGTSITTHFNSAAEGIVTNDYYMTPALSKLAKDGLIKVICIWMQGFADSNAEASANAYAANLATLASDKRTYLRSKVVSAVEFDIVVCESPDFTGAPSVPAYVDTIQAAQLAFASTGRRNYSISKPDTVTFTNNGGIHIDGQTVIRYADKVYDVVKNL